MRSFSKNIYDIEVDFLRFEDYLTFMKEILQDEHLAEELVTIVFKATDTDHNGVIDQDEFLNVFMEHYEEKNSKE